MPYTMMFLNGFEVADHRQTLFFTANGPGAESHALALPRAYTYHQMYRLARDFLELDADKD